MNLSIILYVNDHDIVYEACYFELYVGIKVISYIRINETEPGVV